MATRLNERLPERQADLSAPVDRTLIHRPELLRLGNSHDRARWLELRASGVETFDTLDSQLRELVRSLRPAERFSAETLGEAVARHLGDRPLEQYGVWVFYPWSHRLVHLLDADEFALVRTDRNRNKITREEQAVLATKRVGVVGLSVGQSVALTLALERSFGELRIADPDTLDLSNLNRVRSGLHHVGLNKCVNVAREIAEIDPFLKVTCYTEGLNAANAGHFFNDGGALDLLIEECDSVDVKILARQKAKALRIPVLMDTSDRGMVDVERFDLEPDRPILHGLIAHLDPDDAAKAKTNEEKMPFLAPFAGLETLSPRMKASLLELNRTVVTWPQLASSVVLGGALVADAARRILLGTATGSGRSFTDMEVLVAPGIRTSAGFYQDVPDLRTEALSLETMLAAIERCADPSEPRHRLSFAEARELAEAGALAPSAGNMQPWKFLYHRGQLHLFHDRARSASRLDPDDLIPGIALGACIENMYQKAAGMGKHVLVSLGEDHAAPLVAVISASGVTSEALSASLAGQIEVRHTNRRKSDGRAIEAAHLDLLRQAGAFEGAAVITITERDRIARIAAMAGAAERVRIMNPSGHFEFFQHEVRWTDEQTRASADGLDVNTLEVDAVGRVGLRAASDPEAMAMLRAHHGGRGFEKMSFDAIIASPAVALIHLPAHSTTHRLNGGRAAQRLWLQASALDIAVHPISAAIFLGHAARILGAPLLSADERRELLALREELIDTCGIIGREPLFLLRLSHAGPATARSLRRPLTSMLFTTEHEPTWRSST